MTKLELSHLRPRLVRKNPFSMGSSALDCALNGGLERAALHEVLAVGANAPSGTGFSLALTQRAATPGHDVIWIRQAAAARETGAIYGPGFVPYGLSPSQVTVVTLGKIIEVLRAGIEAARCKAVGAVLIETADTGHKIDLTATRRLMLAAEKSCVTVILMRTADDAQPSAAQTRWLVQPLASRPIFKHALGPPRFGITLLKQRTGPSGMHWHVEWNSDRLSFEEAVSQPVAAVPVGRPIAA